MLASFPGSSRIRADDQQQKLRTRPGFFVRFFLSFFLFYPQMLMDRGLNSTLTGPLPACCLLPAVAGMSGLAVLGAVSCRRC